MSSIAFILRKLLPAFLLFGISSASAADFCAELFENPKVPAKYAEDIRLSQKFNTPYRIDDILKDDLVEPVPLYHFDLPRTQANIDVANLDQSLKKKVFIVKNGKQFVRFFIVDQDHARFAEVKTMLDGWHISLEQKFWAVRLQSQFTFFCWDPERANDEPFYLKLQKKYRTGLTRNSASDARAAVRIDQMAEKIVDADPSDFSYLLAEPLATSLNINGVEFANSFRQVKPTQKIAKNSKLWTANGFFGSEKLGEVAAKAGLSSEEWTKREFLPGFARFVAEMSFRYGMIPEGHSQNVMFAVDETSGAITGFALKDLADILYDPFALMALGKNTFSESIRGLGDVARINYIPVEGDHTKTPGGMMSSYMTQTIVKLVTDPNVQREFAKVFIENYIYWVQKFTNQRIVLDTYYRDRYLELFGSNELKPYWEKAPEKYDPVLLLGKYLNSITEGVYYRATIQRLPIVTSEMMNYDQDVLRRIASDSINRYDVAVVGKDAIDIWSNPEKSAELKFAYDGVNVIVYKQPAKIPIPVIFANHLFDFEKANILAAKKH